jgi:hypothetical protein
VRPASAPIYPHESLGPEVRRSSTSRSSRSRRSVPTNSCRTGRKTQTILINLDHPAVKNALKSSGIEDPNFKRLSYEIAFTEYSVALGYEMSERDPDIPADDPLYEVRSTLNRVAASAADLYA